MRRFIGFIFFAILFITGCSSSSSDTLIWIDVPINNLYLTNPQTINIEGHASSPEGIALVEVWVNGIIIEGIDTFASTESMIQYTSSFTPTDYGEYTVQVIAIGNNEVASSPDTARVIIEMPTPVPLDGSTPVPDDHTPTPIPEEDGPTPIPPTPVPEINFWAEPGEIDAGACTTIRWEVANVSSVVFGGREQAFSGSDHFCICETSTYPLTITYTDATTEKFYVTVNVSGSCATPTPVVDTTPPPPPLQLKPLNGVELSCSSDTILRWEAPSDPSGISAYRVQVERHSGDYNWQAVPGSVFTGITDTNLPLSIECGYTYRWRVRAIDGASNLGNWSGWFTFIDPLI